MGWERPRGSFSRSMKRRRENKTAFEKNFNVILFQDLRCDTWIKNFHFFHETIDSARAVTTHH